MGSIAAGDSLLACANTQLSDYQKLLNANTTLEKELHISNERLQSATEENNKIKEILTSKLDASTAKDFANKVKQLLNARKLSKSDEREMLQIHKKIENMIKANEILQAENNYIKRLMEKLTNRVTLENITNEPEQSKDVKYLQQEVDKLRKECSLLRDIEDDYQKLKQETQQNRCPSKGISDQDAENIMAIMRERNNLREKMKLVNQQVSEMRKKEKSLNKDLENQAKYTTSMEAEMEKLQKYYEDQMQEACYREEFLVVIIV